MYGRVIIVHIMVVIICWYMSLDNMAFFLSHLAFLLLLFWFLVAVVSCCGFRCLFVCFLFVFCFLLLGFYHPKLFINNFMSLSVCIWVGMGGVIWCSYFLLDFIITLGAFYFKAILELLCTFTWSYDTHLCGVRQMFDVYSLFGVV